MSCSQTCNQGRTCSCRPLTPAESRKFWRTIGIFAVADLALIGLILWVLK